jgi:hypothetical protein
VTIAADGGRQPMTIAYTAGDNPSLEHRLVSQETLFHTDLLTLYRRAGAPDADTMARRSGRPATVFGFLRVPGLPAWDEVSALLTAIGRAGDAARWRHRWARLDGKRRRDSPPNTAMDAAKAVITLTAGAGEDKHRSAPLNKALSASSPGEFAEALTQMRLTAGVSYADIERISKRTLTHSTAHRMTQGLALPRKREQVIAFVTACGGSLEEGHTWWEMAQRIRRGEPARWRDTAVPVAGLVDRDNPDTLARIWQARPTTPPGDTDPLLHSLHAALETTALLRHGTNEDSTADTDAQAGQARPTTPASDTDPLLHSLRAAVEAASSLTTLPPQRGSHLATKAQLEHDNTALRTENNMLSMRNAELAKQNTTLAKDNTDLKTTLDTTLRAFRTVDAQLAHTHDELTDARTGQFILYDRDTGMSRPARWAAETG